MVPQRPLSSHNVSRLMQQHTQTQYSFVQQQSFQSHAWLFVSCGSNVRCNRRKTYAQAAQIITLNPKNRTRYISAPSETLLNTTPGTKFSYRNEINKSLAKFLLLVRPISSHIRVFCGS